MGVIPWNLRSSLGPSLLLEEKLGVLGIGLQETVKDILGQASSIANHNLFFQSSFLGRDLGMRGGSTKERMFLPVCVAPHLMAPQCPNH